MIMLIKQLVPSAKVRVISSLYFMPPTSKSRENSFSEENAFSREHTIFMCSVASESPSQNPSPRTGTPNWKIPGDTNLVSSGIALVHDEIEPDYAFLGCDCLRCVPFEFPSQCSYGVSVAFGDYIMIEPISFPPSVEFIEVTVF
jgi:hypothetical protein